MELTLTAECWWNFVRGWQKWYAPIITTNCFIPLLIDRDNNRLLPLLRQFLLITNRINKCMMDLRANCFTPCFNQFGNLCLFRFPMAISNSKALGSGNSDSAVSTFSSWEKLFLHLTKILLVCNQITLLNLYCISSRLATLLKVIDALQKSVTFLVLLLFSSSSVLAFRWLFSLFVKYLLASRLALFRLSTLLWFGSCKHYILSCFF